MNLWKEKISVADQIANTKLLSQQWIYHNILELSDDEIEGERQRIQEDVKRTAELSAIEQQSQQGGSEAGQQEPQAPEEQPTTPSEEEQQIDDVDTILASLKDSGEESEFEEVPEEELEEAKMGRPKVGIKFGQDSHPRGRDPLGHKENSAALTVGKQRNDKRKSPLALTKEIKGLISKLNNQPKRMIMEKSNPTGSLLDENNILDLEN